MQVSELKEKARTVIDSAGNKRAILLDYAVWSELIEELEDMEAIDEARQSGEELIPLERALKELRARGIDVSAGEPMPELDRITFDPDVMGGRACIRGMRVTVSLLLNLVASGMSDDEIVDAYPYVEREDIRQAILYAAWLADGSARRCEDGHTRPFGLCAGEFVVPDDFDDPLPDHVLDAFEGRS